MIGAFRSVFVGQMSVGLLLGMDHYIFDGELDLKLYMNFFSVA